MTEPFVAMPEEPSLELRPEPEHIGLFAAVAGLLLVLGMLAVLGDLAAESEGGRVAGAIVTTLACIAAYAVTLSRPPRPLAIAAVVVLAIGVALPTGFFLSLDGAPEGRGAVTIFVLVPTLLWAALYLTGPTKGRPVFLGLALLGAYLVIAIQVVGGNASGVDVLQRDGASSEFATSPLSSDSTGTFSDPGSFQLEPQVTGPEDFFSAFFFGVATDAGQAGAVALVFGLGYGAVAVLLDRRGRFATATPFVVAANTLLILSALLIGTSGDDSAGALLAVAIGGSQLVLGARMRRRLTAWLGVAVLTIGITGLAGAIVDDATPGGLLVVVGGAAVLALALELERRAALPPPAVVIPPPAAPPPPPEPPDDPAPTGRRRRPPE